MPSTSPGMMFVEDLGYEAPCTCSDYAEGGSALDFLYFPTIIIMPLSDFTPHLSSLIP